MRILDDHIVFAGGGTAGHLFPGLAVAEYLKRHAPALRITFAGTGKAFEERHVRAAGFNYVTLPCRPFPQRAREALRFVTENVSGYYAARRVLAEQDVALVVGLGGYASVPAARAAARLQIPYVLLEQNVVPGRATRWLAPRAAAVCSAFDGLGAQLRGGTRVVHTGNPLRREYLGKSFSNAWQLDRLAGPRQLLVLGGSGGAHVLNEQVPRALYKAAPALADWRITHQTGTRDLESTRRLYGKLGIRAEVLPFIDALPRLLRASHLAISRAGGTTLAELAISGVPAILLPFPQAADDHQRRNADVYTHAGASLTLDERELNGRFDNHVAKAVVELATDHPRRQRMSEAARQLAQPDATRRISQRIAAILSKRKLATA